MIVGGNSPPGNTLPSFGYRTPTLHAQPTIDPIGRLEFEIERGSHAQRLHVLRLRRNRAVDQRDLQAWASVD
jgi:hypothetical protein